MRRIRAEKNKRNAAERISEESIRNHVTERDQGRSAFENRANEKTVDIILMVRYDNKGTAQAFQMFNPVYAQITKI